MRPGEVDRISSPEAMWQRRINIVGRRCQNEAFFSGAVGPSASHSKRWRRIGFVVIGGVHGGHGSWRATWKEEKKYRGKAWSERCSNGT